MVDRQHFSIDRKGRQIIARQVVSRRQIGTITESDVASLVADSSVRFFVNRERDTLDEIINDDIASLWETELRDHIASDEEACLDDFENGYMFFAELWKEYGSRKIVVLYYHH